MADVAAGWELLASGRWAAALEQFDGAGDDPSAWEGIGVAKWWQLLRVRDLVRVTIRGVHEGSERVTCVIPGHEQTGEELVANELVVDDDLLELRHQGVGGYQSTFDCRG